VTLTSRRNIKMGLGCFAIMSQPFFGNTKSFLWLKKHFRLPRKFFLAKTL
jgi:hypothetical protein